MTAVEKHHLKELSSPGESKRVKLNGSATQRLQDGSSTEQTTFPPTQTVETALNRSSNSIVPPPVSRLGLKPRLPSLPPSLQLVTGVKPDLRVRKGFVGQEEVGIIGYAGPKEVEGIKGIIKQRFTDFLVNEVLPNGDVLHLLDISRPAEPNSKTASSLPLGGTPSAEKGEETDPPVSSEPIDEQVTKKAETPDTGASGLPVHLIFDDNPSWSATTSAELSPHFSDETIIALHTLLVQGKTPPPKSDTGWVSRIATAKSQETAEEAAMNAESSKGGMITVDVGGRGQGRDRGRGRGSSRGSRGRGAHGSGGSEWWAANEDTREVISQIISRKEDRAAAHGIIRKLFSGTFESNVKQLPGEDGQRLAIRWTVGRTATRDNRSKTGGKELHVRQPPYIHFTMQKSNRDTQDCLSNLSRLFNLHPKDFSVCGTKDKRAVTVQRVCVKRGRMTAQAVWDAANGIRAGRRNKEEAVLQRGDRGCRIGDITYSDQYLELGMLKGNQFLITLRNVAAESPVVMNRILESVRDSGFINFYGMQRFGTSTVPTHITGLLLLQSKWTEAIDSLLELREGEHPDCVRARLAWLEDKDFTKALELMPRRCVAERCIWEFWHRGRAIEDRVGALNSLPRNLRTMYVHAYQSYIWNLVVSQRIALSSNQPLVGDLVYASKSEDESDGDEVAEATRPSQKKDWETTSSKEVKQLTEEDLAHYTIFDVIMPLPGWNVDYPGGTMGQLYFDFLTADGLDPNRMRRDQREFSLPGSYRRIINKPAHLSWEVVRYTDPDISLVQSDEDKILGIDLPAKDEVDGKFQAIKISLTLGTSAYATMALREITREETSVWHQISLTNDGADQAHKGSGLARAEDVQDS